MTPLPDIKGKLDSESSINKSRQPSETKTKTPESNVFTSNTKSTSIKPSPAQLFDLISKNYESWLQAMAKQFEDEENFSPFPTEDDLNPAKLNPIFNYNLLEALESASNQAGEKIQEITNDGIQKTSLLRGLQNGASTRPIKHPKRKIICPPQSLLNDTEIDFIRDKIAQIIKQKDGGSLPKNFNLFESGYSSIHLHGDDNLNKISSELENNGELNPTSIEIEFSPIPECKTHGIEDCDCPIFDETYASSRLSSRGILSGLRHTESDDDDGGPSCEFTFEYDGNGKLLPTGNNIEERLKLMSQEATKLRGLQDEFSTTINEADEPQQNSLTKKQLSTSKASSSSSSLSKRRAKVKRKLKQVITDPLDDLKRMVKELSQEKLEKYRLQNRQSATPRNYYGLIPNENCCLLCQYEAVFGMKPRYLVAKKAS